MHSWDFSEPESVAWKRENGMAWVSSNSLQSGRAFSFALNSGEDWVEFLHLGPLDLEPEKRYEISFDYAIDGMDSNSVLGFRVKCQEKEEVMKRFIPRREEVPEVAPRQVAYDFVYRGSSDQPSLQFFGRGKGLFILDNVRIRRLPHIPENELLVDDFLAPRPEGQVPFEPVGLTHHADRTQEFHAFGPPYAPGYGAFTHEQTDKAVAQWKELGIQWVRMSFAWDLAGAKPGELDPNYLARFDYILDRCDELGIRYYIQFIGTPRWASREPDNPDYWWASPPNDFDAFGDMLRQVVRRYRDRVDHWEIWNEPDWVFWSGTVEEFAELHRFAANLVRQEDPGSKILMGGLATDGVSTPWLEATDEFMQRFLALGVGDTIDIFSIHIYEREIEDVLYFINRFDRVLQAFGQGDKPIWITEIGWSTYDGTTEEQKAHYLSQAYRLAARHPRIEKVFFYNHRCKGPDTSDMQSRFGIVEHGDMKPLPAYEALREIGKKGLLSVYDTRFRELPLESR